MSVKAGAVAALMSVALAACSRQPAAAPGAQGMPPTAVEIAVARSQPIEDATEYVATLKSRNSTTIQPQIDGQITHIYVKSGDRVKAGAPLMQIGEGFAGEGPNAAHINTVLGSKDGAVGSAWATALGEVAVIDW